jgi:hypothetical protein
MEPSAPGTSSATVNQQRPSSSSSSSSFPQIPPPNPPQVPANVNEMSLAQVIGMLAGVIDTKGTENTESLNKIDRVSHNILAAVNVIKEHKESSRTISEERN